MSAALSSEFTGTTCKYTIYHQNFNCPDCPVPLYELCKEAEKHIMPNAKPPYQVIGNHDGKHHHIHR